MPSYCRRIRFEGNIVIVGFGSVGQGILPLLLRHIEVCPEQITIISAHDLGASLAASYGIDLLIRTLTRENYAPMLKLLLKRGDFLLNLSVDVSSVALVELCQRSGAFYLDSCIEPWAGGYTDPSLRPSERSSYALRESALALRSKYSSGTTAILAHGANPGLVSHFVKQALVNLAQETGVAAIPTSRAEWGKLSRRLGIKVIHISERDSQVSALRKRRDEFVNTWSVEGFVTEASQPAELGWGSHERHFPADGAHHEFGS